MNCPSPVHGPAGDGMNQNPSPLSPALTTREDLNGMANLKARRRLSPVEQITEAEPFDDADPQRDKATVVAEGQVGEGGEIIETSGSDPFGPGGDPPRRRSMPRHLLDILAKFGKFVGPGFMVSSIIPSSNKTKSRLARSLTPL